MSKLKEICNLSKEINVKPYAPNIGGVITGVDLSKDISDYEQNFIKEAFYKAQFPLYKSPLNFKDIALDFDFTSQTAELTWLAGKSPISKLDYANWIITYQIIKDTCFVLCSKSNKVDKSN